MPQTAEEAALEAQEYIKLKQMIEKIDADEKAKIKKIKQEAALRRKPLIPKRDQHFEQAHAWAEANRGDRKTIELPNGRTLKWRLPSSSKLIVIGKLETIVRLLLRLPHWRKYLGITLKKNNIKADLDELNSISGLRRGLRLDNTEYFSIS